MSAETVSLTPGGERAEQDQRASWLEMFFPAVVWQVSCGSLTRLPDSPRGLAVQAEPAAAEPAE